MKALVIYRPNSEYARRVEEYVTDFKRRYPDSKMELLNIDSREGSATASIYDIVQYPAFMVIREDGGIQNSWQGERFPLMDEVAGYIYN